MAMMKINLQIIGFSERILPWAKEVNRQRDQQTRQPVNMLFIYLHYYTT